jgi:hypothetical protein
VSDNHKAKEQYTKDCGCRKCGTYADITVYYCGCVEVVIYNDRNPCDECTDFSGKRRTAHSCR